MTLPENTELRFGTYCAGCPVRDIVLEDQPDKVNPMRTDGVVVTCSHYHACERLYNMNTYGSEVA